MLEQAINIYQMNQQKGERETKYNERREIFFTIKSKNG